MRTFSWRKSLGPTIYRGASRFSAWFPHVESSETFLSYWTTLCIPRNHHYSLLRFLAYSYCAVEPSIHVPSMSPFSSIRIFSKCVDKGVSKDAMGAMITSPAAPGTLFSDGALDVKSRSVGTVFVLRDGIPRWSRYHTTFYCLSLCSIILVTLPINVVWIHSSPILVF